jgi:hypothetical protein
MLVRFSDTPTVSYENFEVGSAEHPDVSRRVSSERWTRSDSEEAEEEGLFERVLRRIMSASESVAPQDATLHAVASLPTEVGVSADFLSLVTSGPGGNCMEEEIYHHDAMDERDYEGAIDHHAHFEATLAAFIRAVDVDSWEPEVVAHHEPLQIESSEQGSPPPPFDADELLAKYLASCV